MGLSLATPINALNIRGLLIRLSGVRASSASAMKPSDLCLEAFFVYIYWDRLVSTIIYVRNIEKGIP